MWSRTMPEDMGEFWTRIARWKISRLENDRLNWLQIVQRRMMEDAKAGRTTEDDFPRMTESVLEVLTVYRRFGMTPHELHDKQGIWLRRPGDRLVFRSLKAISMLMSRVRSAGLAERRKEAKTYICFINANGSSRLDYSRKKRAEMQAKKQKEKSRDEGLAFTLALNNWRISEIVDMQQKNELLTAVFGPPGFSNVYSHFGNVLLDMAYAINLLQNAIFLGNDSTLCDIAIEQGTSSLERFRKIQNALPCSTMLFWLFSRARKKR